MRTRCSSSFQRVLKISLALLVLELSLCVLFAYFFAGFLRFSELCSIRAFDVRLYSSNCSLFLESPKTDQLREGAWISIARSGKVTCPVAAIERYLAAAGIKLDEDFLLFVRWHLQKFPRRLASMASLTQEQEK